MEFFKWYILPIILGAYYGSLSGILGYNFNHGMYYAIVLPSIIIYLIGINTI